MLLSQQLAQPPLHTEPCPVFTLTPPIHGVNTVVHEHGESQAHFSFNPDVDKRFPVCASNFRYDIG